MKRNGVRKFVFGLAIASFGGAVAVLGLAFWSLSNLGSDHLLTASLFPTSFFLGCCGIVLYFMSVQPKPIEPDKP